jgi:hypothetical protein
MIKSRKIRWLISAAILGVAIIIAFLSYYPAPSTPLTDLKTVNDLRNQFNRDKGSPRLILLLSPT